MPELNTVTRRKAAMVIAGSLTASAAAATSMPGSAPVDQTSGSTIAVNAHRHIAGLLRRVRGAHGTTDVAKAFDRCKAALRLHELCEASPEFRQPDAANRVVRSLYRHPDPSTILAKVIVRELDALPKTDVGWMQRFADLEAAFHGHVETVSSAGRAS